MTRLGTVGGVTVLESRAQHPEEIAADLRGARMLTEGAVVVLYEPVGHLRTAALAGRITEALTAADHTVLMPVHSASVRSQRHADGIEALVRAASGGTLVIPEPGSCQMGPDDLAVSLAQRGDLILTIGPDAARRIGPHLLAALDQPRPAR